MNTNLIVLLLFVAALVTFILAWFNAPINNAVILGFIFLTIGFIVGRLGGDVTSRP